MTPETSALVLQGGGALGAYQAGAVDGLTRVGHPIDWVAGISIGAINSALIAGNPKETRTAALRAFWEMATASSIPVGAFGGAVSRGWLNDMSAAGTALWGVPGFFIPRWPAAAFMPKETDAARSFYDTAPLRATLLEMADFDLINNGPVRLCVGAVNVETGNMKWFDSADTEIRPEHIMASGALPPGFPAIEIDGAFYWNGGLVSNTPLQYVLDEQMPSEDLCVFQVDLFNARGSLPPSVWNSEARQKEIRFSSRTRFNTDMMRRLHETRDAARRLYEKLPPELKKDPDARALAAGNADPHVTIAHLIYRQAKYEHQTRDYEFSRRSMLDHWTAGRSDVERTFAHPDWIARHDTRQRVKVFDLGE